MKSHPKASVVILTRNRKDQLRETIENSLNQFYSPLEVVVIDNGSSDGTRKMCEEQFGDNRIVYRALEENRGVAGGRNVGIKEAEGKILVFIDDDAVFSDAKAVLRAVNLFEERENLGAIAFKSIDADSKRVVWQEIPLKDRDRDYNKEQATSYFVGVGHAIKREVFETVGIYSDRFTYAFEELDLSFRIIDAGYSIIYKPEIEVLHKNSAESRIPDLNYWKKMLENRIRTSIRNLPWRHVFVGSLIWSGFVFFKSRGRVGVLVSAYKNLLKDRNILLEERKTVSPETLKKLKDLQGRVYF